MSEFMIQHESGHMVT